jgi:tRNA 2-thiouridine synthesizing protein A
MFAKLLFILTPMPHKKMETHPMPEFDQELDASGLNCPLPILRAKKSLSQLSSGQVLKVISTDPGSVKDFEAFAKQTGNVLESSTEEGGKYHFSIRKS